MNSDLKQLIRLQSVDLSIQELRSRVDRFPGISKALDEKLKAAQAALESAKEKAKNISHFELTPKAIAAEFTKGDRCYTPMSKLVTTLALIDGLSEKEQTARIKELQKQSK